MVQMHAWRSFFSSVLYFDEAHLNEVLEEKEHNTVIVIKHKNILLFAIYMPHLV
jgi:hypothetical protein